MLLMLPLMLLIFFDTGFDSRLNPFEGERMM